MPADAVKMKERKRTLFQFNNFVNSNVLYDLTALRFNKSGRFKQSTFCGKVPPFETRMCNQLHN